MLNAALQRAVAEAAHVARPADLHFVQCSSTGATGAIIFHAWLRDESCPRVIVKTPRDARLHHALQREWLAVTALRRDPRLADLVPAALANFSIAGAEYFVYEGASGRTMYSRFRNRILVSRASILARFALQAREVIARVHATDTRLAGPAEVAQDLQADLEWLMRSIPDLPPVVVAAAEAQATRLADCTGRLPSGRVHGDFSPYNVLTDSMAPDARVHLIDWEHTETGRPQHLDVFRFASACVLLGLRSQARLAAFRDMPALAAPLLEVLLAPWLVRMSVPEAASWLAGERLEALWWHYWVHATRREQERRADPSDWRDATHLPGLLERATQPATYRAPADSGRADAQSADAAPAGSGELVASVSRAFDGLACPRRDP